MSERRYIKYSFTVQCLNNHNDNLRFAVFSHTPAVPPKGTTARTALKLHYDGHAYWRTANCESRAFLATRWQNTYCHIDWGTEPRRNSDFTLMQIDRRQRLLTSPLISYRHRDAILTVCMSRALCRQAAAAEQTSTIVTSTLAVPFSGLQWPHWQCSQLEGKFPDYSFIDKIQLRFSRITVAQNLWPWSFFIIVWRIFSLFTGSIVWSYNQFCA